MPALSFVKSQLWSHFMPGPVENIENDWGHSLLFLKRLDLIQSWATGNKYYKLKYNIADALSNGLLTIVSKGGMFSNHLEALVRACSFFGIKCVCVIRSYGVDENNPVILKLREYNAELIFLNPELYKSFDKHQALSMYPDALFIPEGGSGQNGIRGTAEIWAEIKDHRPDHIVIPGGTLSTAAGMLSVASPDTHVIIVPSWKGCTREYAEAFFISHQVMPRCRWDIWADYHFGGFGKYSTGLVNFMFDFTDKTKVPLDPVYTGKMMFAICEKIKEGYFAQNDKVIAIHTGGLQGIAGYCYRDPEVWKRYSGLLYSHG